MSRRRVGKVAPISATSPSAPVDIGQTNSILTDPLGRWVAKRQSDINSALETLFTRALISGGTGAAGQETPERNLSGQFSGESERIGQGKGEHETPVRERVVYL